MPNLDAYPEIRNPFRGVRDYCEVCGKPVLGMGVKCVDCQEQDWLDTISNLSMNQIMDRLDDIFEGNEKDFRWDDGSLELTYFGNQGEVAKAKRLLEAREVVKLHTAEDRLCIWLGSYKDKLEIY